MLRSPNPAIQPNKPRLGQGREGPRTEWVSLHKCNHKCNPKMKIKQENRLYENKEKAYKHPLLNKLLFRHIEQKPETGIMPKHTIRPKMTEMQLPIYHDPLMKPPPDCQI